MLARRPGPLTRRRLPLRAYAPLVAVLLVLLVLLAAAPAAAEIRDRPAETPATQVDTTPLPPGVAGSEDGGGTGSSAAGAIAKMVVGLGVVLAVIFGVYWLLKSAGRSKRLGAAAPGAIELISTAALAQGKTLHLVRVGDDVMLVGAAEQSVTRVQSWTGDDARRLELLLQQPRGGGGGAPPVTGFGPRFVEELRRRTVRG